MVEDGSSGPLHSALEIFVRATASWRSGRDDRGCGFRRKETFLSVQRSVKRFLFLFGLVFLARSPRPAAAQTAVTTGLPPPAQLTAERDHQRMMDLLHIAVLRPGADGNHPEAANAANYDEAKANPFRDLPDPLLLKNGKKVTTAKAWWQKRRPEIAEEFDREIYGRVPAITPKV